jgi:hypothetical protein
MIVREQLLGLRYLGASRSPSGDGAPQNLIQKFFRPIALRLRHQGFGSVFARVAWRLAFGVWRLALGAWRLAFGVWRLAFGAWRLALGAWRSALPALSAFGVVGVTSSPLGLAWVCRRRQPVYFRHHPRLVCFHHRLHLVCFRHRSDDTLVDCVA